MNEPKDLPSWLSNKDLNYFTKEFEKSGMFGPLIDIDVWIWIGKISLKCHLIK
jgi:hypothetical protein